MARRMRRGRRRVVNIQSKRPIDKGLIMGHLDLTGAMQGSRIILPVGGTGVSFPGTVTGIRWAISYFTNGATTQSVCNWIIVKCREGTTPNNINNGGAIQNLYIPESDVISWGQLNSNAQGAGTLDMCPWVDSGTTKSMRKLQAGDALHFVAQDNITTASQVFFTIQFFYKT